MRRSILKLGSAIFLLFAVGSAHAQIVSGNGFFKGTFVEAGIQPSGAFGSKVSAPADYVSATVSKYTGRVGFIADVGKDGWTVGTPKYIGDFFVPGTPYEAFSVKMNGTLYENAGSAAPTISGSVTNFTDDGTTAAVDWLGSINNLQIHQITSVGKNSSFILIRIYLKNTGSTAINNLFYTRSVDPDNEVDQGGSFSTLNTIESQNMNSTSTALVSGKGLTYGSYLGLGSRDCRARVAIMRSFSSDGEDIYNGTGSVALSANNATNTADNAIAVSFKLGTLAAGDSTALAMAYVLNAADLPPAMDETDPLFNVKADTYGSGSIINVCSGSQATLNIINGDGYTWTWSPATGLNQTTGRSVKASLSSDITYTASGINSCGTSRSITLNLHPVVSATPDAAGTITGPTTVYKGWNATYSVPAIANTTTYRWTIPTGASFVSGFGTNTIVVKYGTSATSGAVSVYGENSCGTGATSTTNVTLNSSGSSLVLSSGNSGVAGNMAFGTPTRVDTKITITGTDPVTNTRVYIDNGFQNGDQLIYDSLLPSGVTSSYSASTGALTFAGTATPAQWQAIFNAVKFTSTSTNFSDRSIKFVLGDMVSLMIAGKPHYYEYIQPSTNPSWADAYAAAASRTFFGLAGYLATSTSTTENDFIKQKLSSDGWMGASDAYQYVNLVKGTTYTTQSQTEGKWFWVTGPEAGTGISTGNGTPTVVSGSFMNWATGEPNNSGNDENFMQFYSANNGKWNDLSGASNGSVPGYVVEYGGYSTDPMVSIEYSRTVKNITAAPVITSITDDTGPVNNDFITSDRTIKINGTAVANSTVKVTRTGTGVIGTVTADASGNWSYDYSGTTLVDGTYSFTATATAGGVESNNSTAITVKIDGTAPTKPAKPAMTDGDGTNTNNPRPTINGTTEANAVVKIYNGSTLLGTVTADAAGKWSYTFTSDLSDGQYPITTTATDVAGNTSAASDALTINVDTISPDTPSAPVLKDGKDGTINTATPTVTGVAEPNSTVSIYSNGFPVGTATADAEGKWSYTFTTPLTDGTYNVQAATTDASGNMSELSSAVSITVDTQKPAKPATPVLTTDNTLGNVKTNTPSLSGTAEPGSTVSIYDGSTLLTTVSPDAGGNWSYTFSPALTDDSHSITVTSTDVAGNTSDHSDALTVIVDTQKPVTSDAPVLSGGHDGSTNDNTPSVSGTTEPGATVTIYNNGSPVTTVTADAAGHWSYTFTPALEDGTYLVTTTSTDAAGNTSDLSPALSIHIDTQKPSKPGTAVLEGATSGDAEGNINIGTPSIIGSGAEPNSTITIYVNGSAVGTTTVNGDGEWSYTFSPALADGSYTVTTTSTDAAGNISDPSDPTALKVDTQKPAAPSAPVLETENNSGAVKTNTPSISGTTEPGATVSIYDGGVIVGTVNADATGHWSYTFGSPLSDGSHHITTTSTDAAGNESDGSGILTVDIDTQKPVTPSAPRLAGGHDGSTNDNTPSIDGTTEPGATVTIYSNGVPVTTVVADESGHWSYTFTPALTDGEYDITTTSTDAAGNVSEPSAAVKVTVDTQNPAQPTGNTLNDGKNGNINTSTPSVSGSAEPGSTVTIYVNGVPVGTAPVGPDGKWSYTFDPALADGTYNISTSTTDKAGNSSEQTPSFQIKVDTQAPVTPNTPATTGGDSTGNFKTSTPSISGHAEPGSTVTIYDNGVPVATVTVDPTGNWTYTFTPALTEGNHSITTTVTDPAGNTSEPSAPYVMHVDTKVPTVYIVSGKYEASEPFTATITFSEPVTGFSPSSIDITNGTISNFVQVSPTQYTITVTPAYDKSKISVQIKPGAAQDVSGNWNVMSNVMIVTSQYSAKMESVYPNPATNSLNILFKGVTSSKGRVMLVKMSGQIVYDEEISFQDGKLTLDVTKYAAGQYMLIVKTNEYVHRTNVMIMR